MKSIKEVLTELKSFSELVVTIGYAAILQNDPELALEAQNIKNKIRTLSYEMRIATIYAVRSSRNSAKEVTQLASLLQVGVASKEISDGVDDLVEIVLRGGGAHPLLRDIYRNNELIIKLTINKNSKIIGSNLHKIISTFGEETPPFQILFIRKSDEYILGREAERRTLGPEDVVLIKTSEEKEEEVKEAFSQ